MGMTPHQYFETFVEDNFDDYAESPGSIRRAFNAAVSASHLADHYLGFNQKHSPKRVQRFKNIGKFVEFICTETGGAFKDIRSISNAYKHLYTDLDPRHAVHSSVASTGAVECITFQYEEPDLPEISEIEEHYEAGDTGAKVLYRRKDGSQMEFLPTIEKVMEFWRIFLHANGPSDA